MTKTGCWSRSALVWTGLLFLVKESFIPVLCGFFSRQTRNSLSFLCFHCSLSARIAEVYCSFSYFSPFKTMYRARTDFLHHLTKWMVGYSTRTQSQKYQLPPATTRPLQCDPAAFSSAFQHAQGRPGGPIRMQFKTQSSASFPASPVPSQPVIPCPQFLVPTALHPTCRCSLGSPCLLWVPPCALAACFHRQCIYCWLAHASTWTYIQLSLNNFHLLWFCSFPFQFHWTLPAFSQSFFNCNTACLCSPCFFFLLSFFFISTFSMFSLKLWWPFLHCCPFCTFALKRVQV